jgi:hypothetical protein
MTTSDILLNLDLAAGIAALVAMAMIAVPNLEHIGARRRFLTRRTLRRVHEQRLVVGGPSRS